MLRYTFFSTLLLAGPALVAAQELAPLPAITLPLKHTPQPTTAAITSADLMTRLYIFADDSMRGRAVGRLGNAMGTAYIAAEVKRMGLQPAGDSGTYFQNLPDFPPVLIEDAASMRIDGKNVVLSRDFLPFGTRSLKRSALPVIYGGSIGAPMTLDSAKAKGKLVVFLTPSTTAIESVMVPYVAGAAGIALVALDAIAPEQRARIVYANLEHAQSPDQPAVLLSNAVAQLLFGMPLESVAVGAVGKSVTLAYTFVSSARNVVAIIPGSDPVLRHEYVAIGAHNDHLGRRTSSVGDHDSLRVFTHFASLGGEDTGGEKATPTPEQTDSINAALAKLRKLNPPRKDSIYNGADDDGSGSVTVLEIAQHIASMKVKPRRSILFVWHTGEEAGLLGSAEFTSHPTVPRDSIVTQLNIDMVGRGDASDIQGGGPKYIQVIGSQKLSTELGDLIDTVNLKDHHDFVFDYITGEQYYTRSDHYNYAKYGIPIAFFFTGVHPDYHQVTDEPQYIDYEKMARIDNMIDDIAIHVANLDHRPVVDQRP